MIAEPSPSTLPEDPRLAFEREKWLAELDLRKQELEIRRTELSRSRWVNPLVIAVFAAAVAGVGNAAVTFIGSRQQLQLEKDRAEAARILEVVKTNDPDKAAGNLKFLTETGLIGDATTRSQIQTYLKSREPGEGVALPSGGTTSVILPTPSGFFCNFPKGMSMAAVEDHIIKALDAEPLAMTLEKSSLLKYSKALHFVGTPRSPSEATNARMQVILSASRAGHATAHFRLTSLPKTNTVGEEFFVLLRLVTLRENLAARASGIDCYSQPFVAEPLTPTMSR